MLELAALAGWVLLGLALTLYGLTFTHALPAWLFGAWPFHDFFDNYQENKTLRRIAIGVGATGATLLTATHLLT